MNTAPLSFPRQNTYVGLPAGQPISVAAALSSTTAEGPSFSSFQDELAAQSSADLESDSNSTASEAASASQSTNAEQWQQALRSSGTFGPPVNLQVTPNSPQDKATGDQTGSANGPEIGNNEQADASKNSSATKVTSSKGAGNTRVEGEAKFSRQTAARDREVHAQVGSGSEQSFLAIPSGSVKAEKEDTTSLSDEAKATQHSATAAATESKLVDPADGAIAASPVSGDLAVAMQVRSGTEENAGLRSSGEESEGEDGKAGLGPSSHSLVSTLALQQSEPHSADAAQAISPVTDSQAQQASGQAKESTTTSNVAPVDAADFAAELEKAQSEPVRGAHVQIAGENNEKIDIRLFERGGALSVTVRSGDTGLTRALQDHIPELTARLSLDHFRTETWKPSASRNAEQQNPNGGSSSKQGSSTPDGQNANGRQGKQNHQQPDWIAELEAHPVPFFRKG